jgi:hypothetical protein
MTRRAAWLRIAALLCAGALAVHELRYLLVFGAGSGRALARDGHAYLGVINPLVALVVAGVLAQLMRVGARGARAGARPVTTFRRSWVQASAALVFIYAVQELVEGQLAAGHPAGLAALDGNGGLLAVPVALAIGAVVALFLREAPGAAGRVHPGVAPRCMFVTPARDVPAPAAPARPRMPLLARHLAGRAPPLVCA